jgi:class 3 adenylate cyclase
MNADMADLRQSERAKLPDSAFAYIDSTGRRRLPIHDEAHVRNALARFNRVLFEDDASRDRARTKLLRAAKRHGILPVGFIDGQIRPKLPTGQLTLLFADVEGSSLHVAALEDRYGPMLNAVRRIERAAVRTGGGFEVDARADEFFAVFRSAPAAVEAAIGIQRAMASHAWPDGRDVRVRIGLHTGRPTRTPSGYQGISVNAASRLCACGHGGQILMSRAVHTALADMSAFEMRHLGTHRLRGIPDEHDIYQLLAPDLVEGFPPLRLDEAAGVGYRIPH